MYKQYLKQAWQLMKQNRFFSFVYILGTGLAISMVMVMVMAIVYYIRTADIAPEDCRSRLLQLNYASVKSKDEEKRGDLQLDAFVPCGTADSGRAVRSGGGLFTDRPG